MSSDSAAKSLETWSKALANAQRDLGKKGKLPKAHEDIKAYLTKGAALAKTLEDQMKQTEQTLKTYRSTLTDVEAACSDYSQLVSKSDFNLSKSNDDEEKIIYKVQYNLTKCLDEIALGSKTPRKESVKLADALSSDLTSF